jgi:hypothetical protein
MPLLPARHAVHIHRSIVSRRGVEVTWRKRRSAWATSTLRGRAKKAGFLRINVPTMPAFTRRCGAVTLPASPLWPNVRTRRRRCARMAATWSRTGRFARPQTPSSAEPIRTLEHRSSASRATNFAFSAPPGRCLVSPCQTPAGAAASLETAPSAAVPKSGSVRSDCSAPGSVRGGALANRAGRHPVRRPLTSAR